MAIVATVNTGGSGTGTDRDAWIRTRHAALVQELISRGMDPTLAWTVAQAPVAHWGDESGWGRAEWGNNVGNIRAVGQCANSHLLQGGDDAAPAPYCDYPSLQAGIAATLNLLLASRYLPAWNYLVGGGAPDQWFTQLLYAGWHPYSDASVASFRSEYTRVHSTVGDPPPFLGVTSSPWAWVGAALVLATAAAYAYSDRR